MRVPVEWLKEYIKFSVSPTELGTMLTMAGLEVESAEMTDNEVVLEINVTPNRSDCLSVLGIAKEVSVLTGLPLKFPEYEIRDESGECGIKIMIADEDLCYRYAGRIIRDVKIEASPEYIRKRLEKSGMRPVNNVVDITNYVMLEMGHPLHAFDSDKLDGDAINVRRAEPGVIIRTIDGIERKMHEDALLIWDSSKPVAIAGVLGGMETEVCGETRNIFLESAYFRPSSVRSTSRILGLNTEASYRFGRGVDIEIVDKALDRAALMISRIARGRISGKRDVYVVPFESTGIKVRYGRINRTLGISLAEDEIDGLIQRLGIRHEKQQDYLIAIPPSFRPDITGEIDIIEEVARLYGYGNIPATAPGTDMARQSMDKKYSRVRDIKETLRRSGFTEVINYSFVSEAMLAMLGLSEKDYRATAIRIKNPIKTEYPFLRTTLIPSLMHNLVHNLSVGNRDIRLFEFSRVFHDKGEALPGEIHNLGAIYFRDRAPSLWKEATPDFYLVKGVLESMLADLRIPDYSFRISSEPFLHPGRAADIFVSGKKTGFLGVLHPDIVNSLALKIPEPEIIILEADMERLLLSVPDAVAYNPVQKYPCIERDVALVVDDSLPALNIIGLVRAYNSELIEDAEIFDFYKGKNIPAGKKSIAFTIRYRAKDRTLTDAEIETAHNQVVANICRDTGGSVRGA